MKKILFVCTGNTCRSPMAAGLMNKLLENAGIGGYTAESAGLAASPGEPASQNAILAAAEAGVSLGGHRARPVSQLNLIGYEMIFVMSEGHRRMLESSFPCLKSRVRVLGGGIPDPFGGTPDDYRRCRDRLLSVLAGIVKELRP